MKEVRNKQYEVIGYTTDGGEISIHNHIHYPYDWMLTIRCLNLHGRVLSPKEKGIEYAKDKVYSFLEEELNNIENLKKLIAK